ncbi:MAG: glycoside hydrolase family 88 protein, partial [Candidatus Eisenbacteria bacterium]|nr:glycoside hydrolase family 88 protein [Candidatus Eisenbacteria bacterium]
SWIQSVFMTGVMAAYRATGDRDYLDEAVSWSAANHWSPGHRERHADDQCCTQVYLDIWSEKGEDYMIRPTIESFDPLVADPVAGRDLWSWCDALFMAPPAMAALSSATGDPGYLHAMDQMWWDTTDLLYDPAESLFYRDRSSMTEPGGRTRVSWRGNPIFWSRGNGWVLAGTARVLDSMPADYRSRGSYEQLLTRMATRLSARQGEDGLWRPSLLDPAAVQAPETSGSGLFCYGMAWGLNNGLLDRDVFLPVVVRAWDGLLASVSGDGRLGWVQAVGAGPALACESDSAPYGTGAFLLAGSEVLQLERSGK